MPERFLIVRQQASSLPASATPTPGNPNGAPVGRVKQATVTLQLIDAEGNPVAVLGSAPGMNPTGFEIPVSNIADWPLEGIVTFTLESAAPVAPLAAERSTRSRTP